MSKREKREHVNTKWLLRKISANLKGVDADLREMVVALYVHSNTFLEAEDVRGGSVNFSSQASQRQLADYCHLKTEKSAYSRLVRLQGLGIVHWTANRSHKANEYHVQLDLTSVVQTTGDTDEENPFEELPAGNPLVTRGLRVSSVASRGSSVVSALSSVVSESSSVVQTTDSAFSAATLLPILPVCDQPHASLDNFVETRENPGPQKQQQTPEKVERVSAKEPQVPVHPQSQTRGVPPAQEYVNYETMLAQHVWSEEDIKNGSAYGYAACERCGVKAAAVRRQGIRCIGVAANVNAKLSRN